MANTIKTIEDRLAMMRRSDNRWADYYVRDVARLLKERNILIAALLKIYNDNEAKCGCECDVETCCARVGEPCSKCDARAALPSRR